MQMNPNFDAIGKAFAQQYYAAFDSNRMSVLSLYQEPSCVTYSGQLYSGVAAIKEKIESIPGDMRHNIQSVDCQPSLQGSVVVAVAGQILTEGGRPMSFNELFFLYPNQNSFFILNHIFCLNLD